MVAAPVVARSLQSCSFASAASEVGTVPMPRRASTP